MMAKQLLDVAIDPSTKSSRSHYFHEAVRRFVELSEIYSAFHSNENPDKTADKAAELLCIVRSTLYKRMEGLGISPQQICEAPDLDDLLKSAKALLLEAFASHSNDLKRSSAHLARVYAQVGELFLDETDPKKLFEKRLTKPR